MRSTPSVVATLVLYIRLGGLAASQGQSNPTVGVTILYKVCHSRLSSTREQPPLSITKLLTALAYNQRIEVLVRLRQLEC